MLKKRIIPCLDIKDGRTVKGINFEGLRDAGDPVELGALYARQGADELVFLDISATDEKRKTFASLVLDIAAHVDIPFTVGGGISSIADVGPLLTSGADKITVNSAAVFRPQLIDDLVLAYGGQCIVAAIDAKEIEGKWIVHTNGGKNATDKELYSWAKEVQDRGAGEIMFTSMGHDGTKQGFANKALAQLNATLTIPIIASGGAGTPEHFTSVFNEGKADAALAASIFHFKEIGIPELKSYLRKTGIKTR